jgi:hypothetical protein
MLGDSFEINKWMAQFHSVERNWRNSESRGVSMKGYFRFTRYVKSPGLLKLWAMDFSAKNIPWFIEKKRNLFALWRKGTESFGSETKIKDNALPFEIIGGSFAFCLERLAKGEP